MEIKGFCLGTFMSERPRLPKSVAIFYTYVLDQQGLHAREGLRESMVVLGT